MNSSRTQPTIALFHYYELIDDYLETIQVSLDDFCTVFTGSWMFSYCSALASVGVRVVLFCVSAQVDKPMYVVHKPSGTSMCLLPPSPLYRVLRSLSSNLPWPSNTPQESTLPKQKKNSVLKPLIDPLGTILRSLKVYVSLSLRTVAKELRQIECTAILSQEYEYGRFDVCSLLGTMIGVPVYATFQGGNQTQSGLERLIRTWSIQSCQGLIIGEQSEQRRVRQQYPASRSKIIGVPNPLDTSFWYPLDRAQTRSHLNIPLDAKVAIWHGRVEIQRKGLDLLLQAWDELRRSHPNEHYQLILIGTGSDAVQFQQLLDQYRFPSVTWLKTFVNDATLLRQYLSAADVYLFPSRHEGFPVAPLEAMACSLPVVALQHPWMEDILGKNSELEGILVKPDTPIYLAKKVHSLFENPQYCQTLGTVARARVLESFSYAQVGQSLKSLMIDQQYSRQN